MLVGTMLLAAMPGTAFAAYAPVTGNPEDTYDAETWAKLQDNVLEYDEIPDLVHVYNSSISEIWKNLRESKEKIDRNIQELDSQRGKMKNLEEDTKKAIGNNSTLISQRTSAKGTSNASIESRLGVIEEGEQKLTIEMKRLYNDVYTQKEAFEGARAGYQAAQKTHDKYTRMYQMGLLGESDYIGTEISYYQAKSSYESADTALRLAMETYNWGVQGLASIE